MVHQWHLNVSWFDSQVKTEQAAFPTRPPVILPSNLTPVDLQYFCGTSVVVRWWRLRMPSTCWDALLLLWSCIICEMDPWTKHVLEGNGSNQAILSVWHILEWQISSATGFFEEARQSSFDWLIWIGETKTAAVSTDALNGQFPVQTRFASDMVGLTLKVTMLGLLPYQCGLQGSSCLFFQKTVEFPTPPAERKRYPNVSLCRGNNLEDYLNRLGGTKVHNELKRKG